MSSAAKHEAGVIILGVLDRMIPPEGNERVVRLADIADAIVDALDETLTISRRAPRVVHSKDVDHPAQQVARAGR